MKHSATQRWADYQVGKPQVLSGPDKALSHGVVCLTGTAAWDRVKVDSGEQCQHIHPRQDVAYEWICLACNKGSSGAERIASKHGNPVDASAATKPNKKTIKFKPRSRKCA